MSPAETAFHHAASLLKEAELSKLFGHPCYKLNKKAFCCLYKKSMVFKLEGTAHSTAMAIEGAQLFDPSGKKRPMKEWVQLPLDSSDQWAKLSKSAYAYIKKLTA
jgi:hypothetical protein